MMIHMIFDLFPHGWGSGALLKIPVARISCSPKNSQYFFSLPLFSIFLCLTFLERKEEYFIYSIFGFLYMLTRIPYEKKSGDPLDYILC